MKRRVKTAIATGLRTYNLTHLERDKDDTVYCGMRVPAYRITDDIRLTTCPDCIALKKRGRRPRRFTVECSISFRVDYDVWALGEGHARQRAEEMLDNVTSLADLDERDAWTDDTIILNVRPMKKGGRR